MFSSWVSAYQVPRAALWSTSPWWRSWSWLAAAKYKASLWCLAQLSCLSVAAPASLQPSQDSYGRSTFFFWSRFVLSRFRQCWWWSWNKDPCPGILWRIITWGWDSWLNLLAMRSRSPAYISCLAGDGAGASASMVSGIDRAPVRAFMLFASLS